jgi:hypothetical protein
MADMLAQTASDYFANRPRSQSDSVILKDLRAKPDLKSPRLFMSTPLTG